MTNPAYPTITAIGHYHPETVVDNSFIDDLDIGSDAGWIESRTGLKQRHSVLKLEDIKDLREGKTSYETLFREGKIQTLAEMSVPAWNMAVERRVSSLGKMEQPEFAICGTSTPDWDLPANCCSITGELGLNIPSFDINSACSAFIVDLHFLKTQMSAGLVKRAAVFNPERISTRLDYTDRSSCILFGDAATATLVEYLVKPKGLALIDSVVHSTPVDYRAVQTPEAGTFNQNGRAVQKFAVSRTVEVTREILERNNLSTDDISYFIAHQANLRMLNSCAAKLGLSEAKHLYNVDQFGNQGCTGAPATLSQNWDKLKSGDYVVISVVGAGLTWASGLFRFY